MRKQILILAALAMLGAGAVASVRMMSDSDGASQGLRPTDYVSTLVGSHSSFSLSTGNTYPAVALPWGMNFWTPQTGRMGDGWVYTYDAEKIRGFKQTHQPSPWINDYGQFSLMPLTGTPVFDQDNRASWFSHKAETAKPYYYSVYLADYDVTAEMTPTERAAMMRFTYPRADTAMVVIDAFDGGSSVTVVPERNMVTGFTTKNSGGVPACTARPTNTVDVVAGHTPVEMTPPTLKTYNAPSSCGCGGGSEAADQAEMEAITRAVMERLKNLR